MSQRRRVVIENFPVEKLPEELRGGIDPRHKVRITIEDRPEPSEIEPRFRRFHGIAAEEKTSIAEAVARVRALRDEWD